MSYWADQGHSPKLRVNTDVGELASSPFHFLEMGTLPFQGHRASLCKEEGTEQQTCFLLGGQCVCLLSQGLDIIEFKKDKYRVCAQLYSNSLFATVNVVCLTSF